MEWGYEDPGAAPGPGRSGGLDAAERIASSLPETVARDGGFATQTVRAFDDLGRHHALDAYTIVGMMTEAEYDRARGLASQSGSDPHFAPREQRSRPVKVLLFG